MPKDCNYYEGENHLEHECDIKAMTNPMKDLEF